MRRLSPAILGSIALHAGVAGLALVSWPRTEMVLPPTIASVPVTIVSSVEIAAAPADNPSEEVVEDDAATAPVSAPEPPPEPTPAPPEPTPAPKKATPAPTPPRAAPTPTPPRATPPRTAPAPARPAPKSDAPALDLDALAGPSRPSTNRGTRPATGQQGAGRAPQATGAQITAIFNQVYPNWNISVACAMAGGDQLRIQVELTLATDGRITAGPTLISPRSDAVYRAAAEGAVRALRQSAPFDVPADFPGGVYRPTFNTERACANR